MKPAAWCFLLCFAVLNCLLLVISSYVATILVVFGSVGVYLWIAPKPAIPITKPGDDYSSSSRPSPVRRNLCTDRYSTSKYAAATNNGTDQFDYIVIGAGLSGLSAAAILTRMNYRVLVLEQHDIIGGGSHTFALGKKSQYHFDSGLHYCVPECSQLLQLCTGGANPPVEVPVMGVPLHNPHMQLNGVGPDMVTYDRVLMQGDEARPFDFMLKEKHLPSLYARFPEHKLEIDQWIADADKAVNAIPMYVLSKLLPFKWQKRLAPLLLRNFRKFAAMTTEQYFAPMKNRRLASLLGSMWIDTGAAPHNATFLMTAAVTYGFPKKGGAFPKGGAQSMSASLVPVIERNGGRVLVRADVKSILTRPSPDQGTYEAYGVELSTGQQLIVKKGVVSSVGYLNTFNHLIDRHVVNSLKIPTSFPNLANSLGFVMINAGFTGATSAQLGIANYNVWYLPTDKDSGCMFSELHEFWKNPLRSHHLPIMITFPSLKEQAGQDDGRTTHTCQILVTVDYAWFREWADQGQSGVANSRGAEYELLKTKWKEAALKKMYEIFPNTQQYIDLVDVSTPLSIEYYLRGVQGAACGLDMTPERFTNWDIQEALDPVTKINNLYLTGQDTLICGQPLVQLAGIITAFRIMGFVQSVRLLLQTIFSTSEQ